MEIASMEKKYQSLSLMIGPPTLRARSEAVSPNLRTESSGRKGSGEIRFVLQLSFSVVAGQEPEKLLPPFSTMPLKQAPENRLLGAGADDARRSAFPTSRG